MPNKKKQILALTERNNELENYFRNTIIPQLFVDAHLILRKYTPPAMRQFNLALDDIGKPITEIINNLRFPTILDNIQHVIDKNDILEKEIQTTDLRWYQMNIIPYWDLKENKSNGVIITFVEITTRIRDLKEQERLISDYETLLDTISHDIKTPITNLILSISLFKRTAVEDTSQYASLLNRVEGSIIKMKDIISELTNTRKEGYKYQAGEELLNFEHIIEDVRLTLRDNILESHVITRNEIEVSEITFSRRKLRTILYNLVSNAIKYKSPERAPEIIISTKRTGDTIVITVKDNGVGIPENKREAIFSKYFRLENKLEGTGIGLYLVKQIVIDAGGYITLKSDPGEGSEFCIYLKENKDNTPSEG